MLILKRHWIDERAFIPTTISILITCEAFWSLVKVSRKATGHRSFLIKVILCFKFLVTAQNFKNAIVHCNLLLMKWRFKWSSTCFIHSFSKLCDERNKKLVEHSRSSNLIANVTTIIWLRTSSVCNDIIKFHLEHTLVYKYLVYVDTNCLRGAQRLFSNQILLVKLF